MLIGDFERLIFDFYLKEGFFLEILVNCMCVDLLIKFLVVCKCEGWD